MTLSSKLSCGLGFALFVTTFPSNLFANERDAVEVVRDQVRAVRREKDQVMEAHEKAIEGKRGNAIAGKAPLPTAFVSDYKNPLEAKVRSSSIPRQTRIVRIIDPKDNYNATS